MKVITSNPVTNSEHVVEIPQMAVVNGPPNATSTAMRPKIMGEDHTIVKKIISFRVEPKNVRAPSHDPT
jgi:hypothetical protein